MRIARRRLTLTALGIAAAALAVLGLTLPVTVPASLHHRLVSAIGERFDGVVELSTIRVSLFPPTLRGESVIVRHKGRTDVPPLITIRSFSAEASVFGLFRRPVRLKRVHLDKLEVNVPLGGLDNDDDGDDDGAHEAPATNARQQAQSSPLVVGELISDDTVVRVLRREPGKRPREWTISRLSMHDTGAMTPWRFEAALTNPVPPGRIDVKGTFGPWNAAEPSRTPLAATYVFREADLGHFDGIRGILRSEGKFDGVLERIVVDGTTDVPDFALEKVKHPIHLQTRFHAIVDGTSGDTWLRPVDGTFRQTSIHTAGGVTEQDGEDGRTVSLDIAMQKARIEDVLYLAVKRKDPPMTGALTVRARMTLPPGHIDVIEKLALDGTFELTDARFTAGSVQTKVNELSRKAQGDEDSQSSEVVSDFTGRFLMRGGVIRFSRITFAVPGARVDLNGTYAVASEALDFRGTVRLDAKLSQLTSGAKGFLLKLVEPFFRRKNVTVVPIKIGGTVDAPDVGLDVGRAFTP